MSSAKYECALVTSCYYTESVLIQLEHNSIISLKKGVILKKQNFGMYR